MFKSKNISVLTWFNTLYNFRFYSVIAVLYFTQVTSSITLAMSIFSITQISQALFEVPTGIFSDQLGRKKSVILGSLASVLSMLSYATGQWYGILALGAVFEGLCRAIFSGNNNALIYETLEEAGQKDQFHHVFGKINSYLEFSGFLSALLGGFLAMQSYQLLMWLSVIPQLICLGLSFLIVEPKHQLDQEPVGNVYAHLKEALLAYRNNWRLRTLSTAHILQTGVGESAWAFQSAFYRSVLPVWAVSFVMSLNFLISTISFRLSGRLINRFKALNLLIYQEIYSRILVVAALVYPTVVSPFLIAAASFVYGPGEVAKNTLLQAEFTSKQRATMASLNSLLGSCFFAVFALVLGLLAEKLGPARSLLLAQLCLVPVVFFYLRMFRKEKSSSGML